MKFLELDKKTQVNICTLPQAVFTTQNPDDETYEQIIKRQERFLKLPENVKNKLISHETAEKIQRIGRHYDLDFIQIASVSRLIRSYYFGEVKTENFSNILIEETGIDKKSADEIIRYVIERIINVEIENKSEERMIKMTLTQAMEKYPKTQDQLISDSLIKIESKDNLVKGSVRNWIKDYYAVVGAGNRDIMKRSSYIYHSQNAKSLSVTEKQKLSIIIKALDENSVIDIDIKNEEIIFNIKSDEVSNTKTVKNVLKKSTSAQGFPADSNHQDVNRKEDIYGIKKPDSSTKINHIQGNKFNLKSDYFEDSDSEKISPMKNSVGVSQNKNNSINHSNEMNVKFSASQQLPVEKENKSKKENFFKNIRPVD